MRYLITGGAGYIGSRLVERLSARAETDVVVVADVRRPEHLSAGVEFRRLDVRDRVAARELLEREGPDALVHLAFVVDPVHDEEAMYAVDVGGTQNVLEAASAAGTPQVLVTSSATAYGAFSDNPVPLTEAHPVRGVPDFPYARHKVESDRLCQLWALEHPDRTMTIVRPCIVFGPTVDNYVVRLWERLPFHPEFGGPDVPIQYVHEDDLMDALGRLLDGRHGGAFNIAPADSMTTGECADLIGLPRRRVPFRLFYRLNQLAWRLHVLEAPAGYLHFATKPWVISSEKLTRETGWRARHSSREAFQTAMRARGLLPALGGPPPAQGVPAEAARGVRSPARR